MVEYYSKSNWYLLKRILPSSSIILPSPSYSFSLLSILAFNILSMHLYIAELMFLLCILALRLSFASSVSSPSSSLLEVSSAPNAKCLNYDLSKTSTNGILFSFYILFSNAFILTPTYLITSRKWTGNKLKLMCSFFGKMPGSVVIVFQWLQKINTQWY